MKAISTKPSVRQWKYTPEKWSGYVCSWLARLDNQPPGFLAKHLNRILQ